MVARTGGRLLEPRAATTFAGTSIPAAVLPDCRILVRNLIAALCLSRLRRIQGLGHAVVTGRELHDADVVAEGIAEPEVGAIEVLFRLRSELDAATLQRLVGLLAVVGGEAERETGRALGNELADLRRRLLVHRRWPGQLEEDVASGLAGHSDGYPTHEPEVHVFGELHPEHADVKVDCLVLVEYEDARHVDPVVHRFCSCVRWL